MAVITSWCIKNYNDRVISKSAVVTRMFRELIRELISLSFCVGARNNLDPTLRQLWSYGYTCTYIQRLYTLFLARLINIGYTMKLSGLWDLEPCGTYINTHAQSTKVFMVSKGI